MSYPHEQRAVVQHVGGLPVTAQAKRVTPSTSSPSDARELVALRSELDELWRAIGNVAPSDTPADAYGVIERLDAQLRALSSRLDALEKNPHIDKVARDGNRSIRTEFNKFADDMLDLLKKALGRIEGIEAEVLKQRRTIDDTILSTARQHDAMTSIATWQTDAAMALLVNEARLYVAPH